MYDDAQTIVAIATPPGEGGIGIVRMSGNLALPIIKEIFRTASGKKCIDIKNRYFYYGHIVDKRGEIIDEVLMVCMMAPGSYTREDVVEIHCHGGMIPLTQILRLTIDNGARLAQPGEFTKRAFLNGRLDLAQAEAVMDLISAKSDQAAKASLNQMEGVLSKRIQEIRSNILDILAHIEASIDYPEEDIDDVLSTQLREELSETNNDIQNLLDGAKSGKLIRQGISTVIVGKPNVGKSSLLNAMVRQNRAIVTDIPGTTRDIIEDYITIRGILVKLIDTAGIRETEDVVEKIGVERSRESIEMADLVILMFDASVPLEQGDMDILRYVKDKNVLVLVNKIDKPIMIDVEYIKKALPGHTIIETSLSSGEGIDKIEEYIYNMVFSGQITANDEIFVTNVRHEESLFDSKKHILDAIDAIDKGVPLDLVSIDIRGAWEKLGFITGETISEDLIDRIFSKFCLGK